MSTYIEALSVCPPNHHGLVLFLAGGITGCPDWQEDARQLLAARDINDELIICNPRRRDFPIHDPGAAHDQIGWERIHLAYADAILFWFCAETIQPIVLYELGAWSATSKPIFVGVHPAYPRRQDVLIQTGMARPEVTVRDSLDAVVDDAIFGADQLLNSRREQKLAELRQ